MGLWRSKAQVEKGRQLMAFVLRLKSDGTVIYTKKSITKGINEILRQDILLSGTLRKISRRIRNYRILISPIKGMISLSYFIRNTRTEAFSKRSVSGRWFPNTKHDLYFFYGDYQNEKRLAGGWYLIDASFERPVIACFPNGTYMVQQPKNDTYIVVDTVFLQGVSQSIRCARKILEHQQQ